MWFLYVLAVLFLSSFSNENEKYLHLGSTTPYRFLANNNATQPEFHGCIPKKLWMITRHGTRNPSARLIKRMKENLTKIRDEILSYSSLSLSQTVALQNWKIRLDENDANQLTEEGKHEMFLLARRMQQRYPSFFPSTYTRETFSFKYTSSERTNDSAQEFAIGLFGHEGAKNVYYDNSNNNDYILRFYKFCKKWQNQVKNNPESYEEKQLFDEGSIMIAAVNAMNEKLNLKKPLIKEAVKLIYSTCASETAWNEKKSVWCDFLSLELMKILEFSDNLESFYVHGYGYNVTYEQACPLFNDMIQHFTSNKLIPTTAVYFTHSGTILKFLAHLGLYKNDQPLKHTDYKNATNKWTESKLDAFGSNIAFVLYTCGDQDKVAVYHQERIVKLPNCMELCDLNSLKEIYRKSIDCEFDKICLV